MVMGKVQSTWMVQSLGILNQKVMMLAQKGRIRYNRNHHQLNKSEHSSINRSSSGTGKGQEKVPETAPHQGGRHQS
ncbi:hypothetical protein C5167_022474 [Papaver somniferum]|uniref:Uncharacterized protein n=1 Tax=Papaver somniferum TaxID=3469 RepID=A0A4Y7JL11_PAPSO|nr:hypothetical protein C5167_022474 [Papaver somniferum]